MSPGDFEGIGISDSLHYQEGKAGLEGVKG